MTKIAVISTVRAPLQELQRFINYHLNIGIDEIILFFDDPHDAGIASFSKYQQVSTVACTPEYWSQKAGEKPADLGARQILNVNEGVQIAAGKKCGWIVHIDSDELINPSTEIKY